MSVEFFTGCQGLEMVYFSNCIVSEQVFNALVYYDNHPCYRLQAVSVRILLFKQLHCSLEEGHQPVSLPSCSHTGHNPLSGVTGRKMFLKYTF